MIECVWCGRTFPLGEGDFTLGMCPRCVAGFASLAEVELPSPREAAEL